METMTMRKVGGVSLIVGPLTAIVFFLLQPGGLLVDSVPSGDAVETITAYASNAGMTRVTSLVIAISLVVLFYGQIAFWRNIGRSGGSDTLVGYGLLFLLMGVAGWSLTQGVHFELAGTDLQSPAAMSVALSAYTADAGITLAGSLLVSVGFILYSLGVSARGGLYKSTGLLVTLISLVALVSVIVAIISPENQADAIRIARMCYFPWVIWSVGLGVALLKEE
jgi:hypothetical protein